MTAYDGSSNNMSLSESIKIPLCNQNQNSVFQDSSESLTTVQESDVQELILSISNLVDKLSTVDEIVNKIQNERDKEKEKTTRQQEQPDPALETTGPEFERCTVRLDGIEVYAVVSALTVASSIACLDTYGDLESGAKRKIFTLLLDVTFSISNVVGILTGLHSTLVFSMVTMYGRTAIGLSRDLAFRDFFRQTGQQRYKAFKTFLVSLYSFIVQCILTIAKRRVPFGPFAQFIFIGVAGYFVRLIINETNFVVDKAGVIFDQSKIGVRGNRRRMSEGQIRRTYSSEKVGSSSKPIHNLGARPSLSALGGSMASCRDVISNGDSDDKDIDDEKVDSSLNNSSLFSSYRDIKQNPNIGLRQRRVSFKDAADGLKELLPRMAEFDNFTEDDEN